MSLGDIVAVGALAERKGSSLNSLKALGECPRLVPIAVGSHVGAKLAAGRANEARFEIRQPNIVRPSIAADRDEMAAPIIRAIDQEAMHA